MSFCIAVSGVQKSFKERETAFLSTLVVSNYILAGVPEPDPVHLNKNTSDTWNPSTLSSLHH
jgi:hypothetical protein